MTSALTEQDCQQNMDKASSQAFKPAEKCEILHITTMPDEILCLIAKQLPPVSAALFSLCSRRLFFVLGKQHFSYIREGAVPPHRMPWDDAPIKLISPQQTDHLTFLKLLGRDIPHLILCYYCQRFHHPSKTGSDANAELDDQRACTFVEGQDNRHLFFHPDFHFSGAQMLMQRHRLGEDCKVELNGLTKSWEMVDRYGLSLHVSAKPRISKGRLYLRTCIWCLFPRRPCFDHLPFIKDIAVCPHISIKDSDEKDHLSFINQMKCAASHCREYSIKRQDDDCSKCRILWPCATCCTEYTIDCRMIPAKRQFRLAVTSWKDLGECLTPFDGTWAHQRTKWAAYLFHEKPNFERWSIWKVFDGKSGRS